MRKEIALDTWSQELHSEMASNAKEYGENWERAVSNTQAEVRWSAKKTSPEYPLQVAEEAWIHQEEDDKTEGAH